MSLPRAEARPLTEAHSPHLATKHRAAQQKVPEPSQPDQPFKAQPLNKKILEGPVRNNRVLTCNKWMCASTGQ